MNIKKLKKRMIMDLLYIMIFVIMCLFAKILPAETNEMFNPIPPGVCVTEKPKGWLSASRAIDIYLSDGEMTNEWPTITEAGIIDHSVTFLDFDFDGVLEMLVLSAGGSDNCHCLSIYGIDRISRHIKQIRRILSPERHQYDEFFRFENGKVKLIQHKNTKRLYYQVYGNGDFIIGNKGGIERGMGIVGWDGSNVLITIVTQLYEHYACSKNLYETFDYSKLLEKLYCINDDKMDSETVKRRNCKYMMYEPEFPTNDVLSRKVFYQRRGTLINQFDVIPMTFYPLNTNDPILRGISKDKLRQHLLKIYKTFSYTLPSRNRTFQNDSNRISRKRILRQNSPLSSPQKHNNKQKR